jgi:hypothetical protein
MQKKRMMMMMMREGMDIIDYDQRGLSVINAMTENECFRFALPQVVTEARIKSRP